MQDVSPIGRFLAVMLVLAATAAWWNLLFVVDPPGTPPVSMPFDHTQHRQRVSLPFHIEDRQSYTFQFEYLAPPVEDRAARLAAARRAGWPGGVEAPCEAQPHALYDLSIPVRLIVIDDAGRTREMVSCTQRARSVSATYYGREIGAMVLDPGDYVVVIEQTGPSSLPREQRVAVGVVHTHTK